MLTSLWRISPLSPMVGREGRHRGISRTMQWSHLQTQWASAGPTASLSPEDRAEGSGRSTWSAPSAAAISLSQKLNQPNIMLLYLIYNCSFLTIILISCSPLPSSAGQLPGASLLDMQPLGQQSLWVSASLRGNARRHATLCHTVPCCATLPVTTYITC